MKILRKVFLLIFTILVLGSCVKDKVPPPVDEVKEKELEKERYPKIEFEQTVYDFGEADQHSQVKYVYKYRNVGDADLQLISVRPTCGCTVPKWSKEPTPPGGKGEIEIVYNTENDHYRISKLIKVETNDPIRKTVNLEIAGIVRGYLVVQPSNGVNFGNVESGYKFTRKVKISPDRASELKIKKIDKVNGDFFSFITKEQKDRIGNEDKDVLMIEVSLNPGYIGPQRGELIVETEHEQIPKITIQVVANIRSKIHLTRNRINLFFQNQEFLYENIFIFSTEKMKITEASNQNTNIKIKLVELEKERLYSIPVWVNLKKADWQDQNDVIVIKTNLSE
ncbi:MAG TPA: DUF1573 domain-containing protein, partial [Firmicutes bacterium]|nr:DUF1573 domain-containing protein [Bacillota bacterium]